MSSEVTWRGGAMSADNWGICPRCKVEALKEQEARQQAAADAYGKVSSTEYGELVAKALEPMQLEETLREDYELGLGEDGEFYVSYRGACDKCALEHSFALGEAAK